MSYTPINWQTGDTITAEKMNKMDNGWGVQNTQLFSETVTTVAGDFGNEAELTYANPITADSITVTFDGNEYTCPVVSMSEAEPGYNGYGGVDSSWEYDFSQYPFAIVTNINGGNTFATQTAGTHTVAVAASTVEVGDNFSAAVNLCIPSSLVVNCISDVTTVDEVQGKLAYFLSPTDTSVHIIVTADSPCTIMPEASDIVASFDRDSGIFSITTV